jgi:hypothetical protein
MNDRWTADIGQHDALIRSGDRIVAGLDNSLENWVDHARLIAAAPEMLHLLCVIHANAAESPEWIRAKINAVVFDGGLL